ncbi:MAG: hypothetical protein ACXWF5_07945 [Actinomycetota bacterium]
MDDARRMLKLEIPLTGDIVRALRKELQKLFIQIRDEVELRHASPFADAPTWGSPWWALEDLNL